MHLKKTEKRVEKDDRKEERCLPISQFKVPLSFSLFHCLAVPIRKAFIYQCYDDYYEEKKYKEIEKAENAALPKTVFRTRG